MAHMITRKSIASLLNGSVYVIPSYQRGYRWTSHQVVELLEDLLEYYNADEKTSGFYCLQPLIVQHRNGACEIVDGQQRMITVYILLKALIKLAKYDSEDEFAADYAGKSLMQICFETHPEDNIFLREINSMDHTLALNINQDHMIEAYEVMISWLKNDGFMKSGMPSVKKLVEAFIEILTTDEEQGGRNVQVVWYELDDSPEVNPIVEFLQINSGKIPLTDSELVKALILQKANFAGGESEQIQHALEWESIENSLMRPGFWAMLSPNAAETDRMRIVLDIIYRKHHNGQPAVEKGDLFRFLSGIVKDRTAAAVWKSVVDVFRLLETWEEDSLIHNYIGLLSHWGESIYAVLSLYEKLPEDATKEAFEKKLVECIQLYLAKIPRKNGQIVASYDKHRGIISKFLLFVNVMQMVHRIEENRLEDHICDSVYYKFPFAAFDSQEWNVEHVDSYTQNAMRKIEDQRAWINAAKECFPQLSEDAQAVNLENSEAFLELIEYIQEKYDCGDEDEEVKNSIGNLALLDEQTNKSYGNHVFAIKAKVIKERIRKGVFVPICTQWVFEKTLQSCDRMEMLKWNANDKQVLHAFLCKELDDFMAR